MSILEKISEYLLKKHYIVFLISLLIALISVIFIPNEWLDHIPFDDKTTRIIICITIVTLFVFLFLTALIAAHQHIKKSKNKKSEQQARREEIIDKVHSVFDKASQKEKEITLYLIKNENKIPYEFTGFFQGCTILNDERFFIKTVASGPNQLTENGFISLGPKQQYLLTSNAYEMIKYVLDETGKLSHFE